MKNTSLRRAGLELFLASFAALCLELALIRWLPGQVRVAAYFPNLILIASFLGLGVGALINSGGAMRLAAGMILVVGSGIALGKIVFTSSDQTEHLWLLYYDLGKDAPVIDSVVLPIIALFIMVAIAFIPLGSEIGRRLALFKDHGQPLTGYAIDLFGSLSGVLAFLMMSEIGTRPIVWFTTGFLAVFGIVPSIVRSRLLFGLAAAVLVLCVHVFDSADRYSPYYGFRTQTTPTGAVSVLTNGSLHQVAIDLRKSPPVSPPPLAIHIGQGYRLGVSNLTKVPRRALVL